MSDLDFASLGLVFVAGLSGISDRACAQSAPPAVRSLDCCWAFESFVFVSSDAVLLQIGQTRDQYKAASPTAERQWRAAWAALGTKAETGGFANIRPHKAPNNAMRKAVS